MTKEDLLKQLENLKNRWLNKTPLSNDDPNYWKYRCDNCLIIGLEVKLKKWGSEIKSAAIPEKKDELYDVAKMIFG